eukprot:scaffold32312_cov61-Phaeocystis_antarctica.AAC.3
MPKSRLSLRLGQLPHDALADLAARLCSESPALQAAAEDCMAAHNPLPHEMIERVLLSPDLVPHILGPLKAEDGAAAAVCSQWLDGWKATNEPRRQLKQVPLDFPKELDTSSEPQMAATPDGRLLMRAGNQLHILDRSMCVLQTMPDDHYVDTSLAASDDSTFGCAEGQDVPHPVLCRTSHDGTVAAEYPLEDHDSPVLAPGGLLFCVMHAPVATWLEDEIIALDAQTLQLRHRFGRGLLDGARQLAVSGDELYACDEYNHRLQVFSLTGEHRRSVTGEWRSPEQLCSTKDRLYLVESDEKDDDADPLQGHRILVLSLQGDILQVVAHPHRSHSAGYIDSKMFTSICCFDDKLLASYKYYLVDSAGTRTMPHTTKYGMLALQGL